MAQDRKTHRHPHPRYPRYTTRRCGTAGGESVPDRLYPQRPPGAAQWDAFRQTLRELSWVEGQNITLEFCPPAREGDAFDELAADLVRLQVDVIVATGTAGVRAATQATRTIPIVMSPGGDPVGQGFEPGAAGRQCYRHEHHGGEPAWETPGDPQGEIVPGASRVAALWAPRLSAAISEVRTTSRVLGVELLELQVTQEGAQAHHLDHAFKTAKRDRADAMIVIGSTLFFGLRGRITDLALYHRLPAIYNLPSYAHAGGLIVYGPSDTEYYRRAAIYVDKILKGAKPAELPVEQAMKFEFVINMKTAKALGLAVPLALLFQETEVIQ